jgi:hypothetical protein
MPAKVIEDLNAPEIFCSGVWSFSVMDGVVSLTLVSRRANNAKPGLPAEMVVTGRLVMPVGGAQNLASGLYNFLKSRGLDPVPKPADPKDVQ